MYAECYYGYCTWAGWYEDVIVADWAETGIVKTVSEN